MNIVQKNKFFVLFLLTSLVTLSVVIGCPKPAKKPPKKTVGGGDSGTNEQVFIQQIDSLNHLENHFGQDSLTHILGRLEGWLANQSSDPAWQEDAFFAEQEKFLAEMAVNLKEFSSLLERIAAPSAEDAPPLTPDDVQKASDAAKKLLEQLTAAAETQGIRQFFEYQQSVREVDGVLTPLAITAKNRNFSEDDIRGFFQGQFQQLGGNTMQLVLYFRDLSEAMNRFAETFRGQSLNFSRLDGDYLKQAFWCRSVSHWAGGNRQEEIERVKSLFDWTVRNIMMQTFTITPQREVLPVPPQAPWESLLFGKGAPSDWGYVFIELLRQQRIDACLLVSDIQNAQGQVSRSPWAVGVLLDGKLHLFLVRYGLPLVAENQITLDPDRGLAFGDVVTLDRLQAEPALLAAYLGDNFSVDQVKSLLQQTSIVIPANPIAGSQRMMIFEKILTGTNKTVLFSSFAELKDRFEKALPGMTVSRWNYPFEANFQSCVSRGAQDMRMELFRISADPQHPYPLWKGRILYLSGRSTGQEAATSELQHACISDRQLAAMMDRQAVAMTEPMTQLEAQIREIETALQGASENDKPELQAKLQELQQLFSQYAAGMGGNFEGLQLQALLFEIAGGTANYWLGQIHFEEALQATNAGSRKSSLSAAYDYINKRVVNNAKGQQWRHGALYHLGRVCEAQGKYDEAIRDYSVTSQEPDNVGWLFRAKQLQRLAPKPSAE